MACPSCVVELVPPFPSLRFGTKVSAHKKAKVQGQETHARVMPRRDTTNASSSIFFKSHHGILELVSSVTLGSIIQGALGGNTQTRPRLGRRQGIERPTKAHARCRGVKTRRTMLSSNHACRSMEFAFISLQSMHCCDFGEAYAGCHRIFQQNSREHDCNISPGMSRSFLWIQCE